MRTLAESMELAQANATAGEVAVMDAAIRTIECGKLLSVQRVANLSSGGLPYRSEPSLGRGEARYESQEVQG
jgi:hypothetical protein